MAHTAACPSCGAPVGFRSAASILAVCEFCRSTLLRQGEALENLGRMAELVADDSPLQLGAEGRWQGRHFALVGCLQLRYESGLWKEWYLLFDDGSSGWLSEASGETVISFLKWVPDPLPAFAEARAGDVLRLDDSGFTVTNVLQAECVAGAGELPFKVGAGYPAPLIDLRSGDRFATIDYSDGKPMVFLGASVPFADFGWTNLREGVPLPQADTAATVLACPNCGAPNEIHAETIETIACRQCGSVSDRYAGQLKLWSRAKGVLDAAPWLPLGSQGTLRGEALTVIGAMIRSTRVAGITYRWREYLLLSAAREFVWLTESDGHWALGRVLTAPPGASNVTSIADIHFRGMRFEHFQKCNAEVDYVLGEFNWKVRVGDATVVDDYVCPPSMLSREWTRDEVTWSLAEYVEPAEIAGAFGVKAPPPARPGVGACQPSPVAERHRLVCRRFWQFAVIAVLIQLASLALTGSQTLLRQDLAFTPTQDEPALTREFVVGGSGKVTVRNRAALANDWVGIDLSLVDTKTGRAWVEHREIAYYYGTDSDGSWTEGSQEDAVVFRNLPAGTYRLALDPEMSESRRSPLADTVEVLEGETVWSNIVLFLVFTALFPIYTRWRATAFEIRRWADSDHPKISESDDDDD